MTALGVGAGAQSVPELGHDRDHSVRRIRGHGRLPQTFEEGPCRTACVANGRCGTDGCGAGRHRDHPEGTEDHSPRMAAPAAVSPLAAARGLLESGAVPVRHELFDHPGIVEGGAGPPATLVNG